MNLQVSFDLTDLTKSIEIAKEIEDYADIIEIGSILIYKYGINAIKEFKENLPTKILLADSKIVDRSKEITSLLINAGCDWVTVMAGTGKNVIHTTSQTAHQLNKKVMLDIIDAKSQGQSALEAKNLGMDAILFHQPYDEENTIPFLDNWEMVKGNTDLPIYISSKITKENIEKILELKPHGIVVGKTIVESENPKETAKFFYELCKK
jgi:3-hexulose-6-phosphate synthase